MNLAQLWKLPVVFVCENNSYNEYTHFKEATAGDVAAARPGVWHRDAYHRRPGRAHRLPDGLALYRARAAARDLRSCSASPIATTVITSATSPGRTTGRRRKSRSGRCRRIRSRCMDSG